MSSIDKIAGIRQNDAMSAELPTNDRIATILAAAFRAFAAYGYRRTTMDDIATAAGLSRTALYQNFRNKEDIFLQLTHDYMAAAVAEMRAVFRRDGPPAEVLEAAFAAKGGRFMEIVLGTPHGRELMEAGFAVAGDLAQQAEAEMQLIAQDWLQGFEIDPALGTAADLAAMVQAGLKGLKVSATTLPEYEAGQRTLARVIAAALGPRKSSESVKID